MSCQYYTALDLEAISLIFSYYYDNYYYYYLLNCDIAASLWLVAACLLVYYDWLLDWLTDWLIDWYTYICLTMSYKLS